MKIYVASKWSRRAEARAVITELRARGHYITHDWTTLEDPQGVPADALASFWAECAEADARGVMEADAVLVLHDPAGRGLYVELGIAIGSATPVIVVDGLGDPALTCPIFYYLPEVAHAPTVEAAYARIAEMARRAA